MKGYNKLYIVWGCFKNAPRHAIDMVRWESLTPEQKEYAYLTMDRTIEF
jgi:hypothetical protein